MTGARLPGRERRRLHPGDNPRGRLSLQYCGHLMRRACSLEKTLMLGKIDGKRRRGRQSRGSGAGTLGVPLGGPRRVGVLLGLTSRRPPTGWALPTFGPPALNTLFRHFVGAQNGSLCARQDWSEQSRQGGGGRAALPAWTARRRRENEAGKTSKQALRVGRVGSAGGPWRKETELGP